MFGQGTMGASESGVPKGPLEHLIDSCTQTGLDYKKMNMEFDFKCSKLTSKLYCDCTNS